METQSAWCELRDLVYAKEFVRAEKLIEHDPELLCKTNSLGETVLHYLAVENDVEGVSWLHSRGASLNTGTGKPMFFEVAELGYKELLLWLARNGADFSALDSEGQGLFECLLDGLEQELRDPSPDERAKAYWRRREETIRLLVENTPAISMTPEQEILYSNLKEREAR